MTREQKMSVIKAVVDGTPVSDILVNLSASVPSWLVNEFDTPAALEAHLTQTQGEGQVNRKRRPVLLHTYQPTIQQTPMVCRV